MPLIETLKSVLGGETEQRQFKHQCGDCETTFEAPEHNPNEVSCPECGSDRIHTAT